MNDENRVELIRIICLIPADGRSMHRAMTVVGLT